MFYKVVIAMKTNMQSTLLIFIKMKNSVLKVCFIISVCFLSVYPTTSHADFMSVLKELTSDEHLESLSFDNILSKNKAVPKTNNGQKELKEMIPLMVASTQFKDIATKDYASALLTLSKDKGMEKLHIIDTTMWDVKLYQLGWKLFFDSAVRIYNKELNKYPLVAYYNPFSDTYLITVWEQDKEGYKIVDAEMLMGDFVRGTSKEIDGTPFWLRGKNKRTVNLGVGTALSTLAFEEVFEKATVKNWRTKLKILQNSEVLSKFNYPNISTSLNSHLLNVISFSSPKDDNPKLQECHHMTLKTVDAVKNGTIDKLLRTTANDTPQDTADILKNIPVEWIDDYTVASALSDSNECLVFLTHVQQSLGSISFALKRKNNDQLLLKRIDLIEYQQFYNMVQKMQDKKSKGVFK